MDDDSIVGLVDQQIDAETLLGMDEEKGDQQTACFQSNEAVSAYDRDEL